MKLVVRSNAANKKDTNLVKEAVPFILGQLLKSSQLDQIHLHISFTSLNGDYGDISLDTAPRFRMRINPDVDTIVMLVTLAHELVHLAQSVQGRLVIKEGHRNNLEWHWLGHSYGTDPYTGGYDDLPWEMEADDQEGELAYRFLSHYIANLNGS